MKHACRRAVALLLGSAFAFAASSSAMRAQARARQHARMATGLAMIPAVAEQQQLLTRAIRPKLARSRSASPYKTAQRQHQLSQLESSIVPDHSFEPISGGALTSGCYPALVLNADYRPLSYLPLSLMSWQDSVRAVCRDSVHVLSTYDRVVRSPSIEMLLPSVIVLKKFSAIHADKEPALTRRNLFLRDHFSCQYCGVRTSASHLTYDHVHPRKFGGKTTWLNTVTACSPCNNRKGSRLLHEIADMHLRSQPRVPAWAELHQGSKAFPPKKMHESWTVFFN